MTHWLAGGSPLPRLSPEASNGGMKDRYDIIIVGAGPAGLMLTLLLSRYGLNDDSVLCIDDKVDRVDRGHADGLQPRTLEVLKSLGLADRILHHGRHLWEFAFWEATKGNALRRSLIMPTVNEGARYKQVLTLHQGLVERELEESLCRSSARGVQRSSRLLDVRFEKDVNAPYPITALVNVEGTIKTYRTKFLVAADGAHSTVRKRMGMHLSGEHHPEDIWGVIDLVADTNFPDIQRRCLVQTDAGTVFIIPREQVAPGQYLTRLYVELKPHLNREMCRSPVAHRPAGDYVSRDMILQRVTEAFYPYHFQPNGDDAIHWWSSYQVGQRILDRFMIEDSSGLGRVFFVGDGGFLVSENPLLVRLRSAAACHTHSPKAGQGMNISMMDAYNLSWKIAYAILGLTPHPVELLETYHTERYSVAKQLIRFDKKYSSMFCSKAPFPAGCNGEDVAAVRLTDAYREANSFASGCGIEYPESMLTRGTFYGQQGVPTMSTKCCPIVLKAGMRLPNVQLRRYADGSHCNLHDDLPSHGCFQILCLTSTDLLDPNGQSAQALSHLTSAFLPRFPQFTVEQLVIYPALLGHFEWDSIPRGVRHFSEMRFYNGGEVDDAYTIYGVDSTRGALVVLRPDGYIGVVTVLTDVDKINSYLCDIVTISSSSHQGEKGLRCLL